MKSIRKITFVATLSVSLLAISSCSNQSQQEVKTEIAAENIVAVDYTVDGMVCAMGCAKVIQEKVAAMNGIANCKVNFEGKSAHIEFDKTQLSEADIIDEIENVVENQYKVRTVSKDEENNEESESVSTKEETIGEVSISDFEIPNLFTFLLDQL